MTQFYLKHNGMSSSLHGNYNVGEQCTIITK